MNRDLPGGESPHKQETTYISVYTSPIKSFVFTKNMEAKLVPLFLATILAISSSSHANSFSDNNYIVMPHESDGDLHHSSVDSKGINCLSWRLAVETNNLQGWKVVPPTCVTYIGNYMLKGQYHVDTKVATQAAYDYAKTLALPRDLSNLWVLDVGQTSLSFLDYYSRPDVQFGGVEYNSTKFAEWSANATIPAVPTVLKLYRSLLKLGFKIVFISASKETQRDTTVENLIKAGYVDDDGNSNWEKLILKSESENDLTSAEYKAKKRTELVEAGYRIWGNLGDQWSDLSHPNTGRRTFKLPNPMFYIA